MGKFIDKVKILKDYVPFESGQEFEFKDGLNVIVGDQGCGKSTLIETIRKISVDFKGYAEVITTNEEMSDYIFYDTEKHNPKYMTSAAIGGDSVCALIKLMREDIANGFSHMFGSKVEGSSEQVIECFPTINTGSISKSSKERIMNELTKNMGEYMGSLLDHHGNHERLGYKEMDSASVNNLDPGVYQMKSHGQSIMPFIENLKTCKDSLILLDEPETALSIRSQHKMADILVDATRNRGCQVLVASHCSILMNRCESIYSMEHKKWMTPNDFIETQD